MPNQPSLTVRAFAVLLESPLYEYERVLLDQKYPKREPTSYRIPYYSPAMAGIRRYFRSNRQFSAVQQAIADIAASSMKPAHRIDNNVRALRSFAQYRAHRRRGLTVQPIDRLETNMQGVNLRFTPDLPATEGQDQRFVIYNFRSAPIPDEVARATLELAHWVLERNGIVVPARALEYVDLFVRRTYRTQHVRNVTIRRARQCARVVAQMWPTL
jgi:hypothetical protein